MATYGIAESLRHRGIRFVCHMTPCDRLPGIVEHGGLLSWRERERKWIVEPEEAHYWGSADKKDAFAGHVICAFMSPWWMCKAHDEELVIILMDADAICTGQGVLFCPGNSAYSDYPAPDIMTMQGIEAFDACFRGNPDTYQAGSSEIMVPKGVPFSAFRGFVFCDAEAKDYWLGRIREVWSALESKPESPTAKLKVGVQWAAGFGFPGAWRATRRVR